MKKIRLQNCSVPSGAEGSVLKRRCRETQSKDKAPPKKFPRIGTRNTMTKLPIRLIETKNVLEKSLGSIE